MLNLSRRVGERLQIGPDIFVTIKAVDGQRVTLGIDAPREVAIRRTADPDRPPKWEDEPKATNNLDQLRAEFRERLFAKSLK